MSGREKRRTGIVYLTGRAFSPDRRYSPQHLDCALFWLRLSATYDLKSLNALNPDSAIQMSEERTCNSEDTQPAASKPFLLLAGCFIGQCTDSQHSRFVGALRGRMYCLRCGRFAPHS